ncbi:hypothetical protein BANRA_01211 [Escherichia coli]|uniref:Uncharacterized protein n=1 Tax=Escherichia coli TaxID=562 RepID=A0A3P5DLD5_ECOLX|nr:hypothetical protein BANRA_01211 [Escherichia coli]
MEYDAAGRVIRLTSENGSHTTFRYDVLDRLIQETGFDGRTQRYHHDLTGKLIRSEDEVWSPTGTMTKQTASRTAP